MKKKERDFITMQNIMDKASRGNTGYRHLDIEKTNKLIKNNPIYQYNIDAVTEVNCEGESYAVVNVKDNLVEVSHEPAHHLMSTWSDYLSCDDVIKIANLIKKIRRENV